VARSLVLLPLYSALSPESAEFLAQNVIEIERNAPGVQTAKRSVSGDPAARSHHPGVSRQEANPRAPAFGNQEEQSSVVIQD